MTRTAGVVRLVRDVLGSGAIAAYLHGSAALGGLRPCSDLDVLVVAERETTAGQRRALVDGLLAISGVRTGRSAARPVELTVVVQSEVRPWRYPPRSEFQYGEWLRDQFEKGVTPAPRTDPDLAVLVTMVLRGNAALFGPPPALVLDPVPHPDLVRSIVAGVPGLVADLDWDRRNVILTLARIWTTLATGAIRSKDESADWVLDHLPEEHRAVLARARAIYLGERRERWDDLSDRVRPHVDHVVAAINKLAATGGNLPG